MPNISADRIMQAVDKAEEAFWKKIAELFPEAKTGDLDIGLTIQTTRQNVKAVTNWVETNITTQQGG